MKMNTELKELLTLAAKACGQEVWFPRMNGGKDQGGNRIILEPCHTKNAAGKVVEWAPRLDDGDNSRMEGKLRIDLAWCDGLGEVTALLQGIPPTNEKYADHGGDEQAARRWASLRAAAQKGRGMP